MGVYRADNDAYTLYFFNIIDIYFTLIDTRAAITSAISVFYRSCLIMQTVWTALDLARLTRSLLRLVLGMIMRRPMRCPLPRWGGKGCEVGSGKVAKGVNILL